MSGNNANFFVSRDEYAILQSKDANRRASLICDLKLRGYMSGMIIKPAANDDGSMGSSRAEANITKTTNDVPLTSESTVVILSDNEEVLKNFSILRRSNNYKSNVILYISEDVSKSKNLQSHYASLKSEVKLLEWCSNLQVSFASLMVIEYLNTSLGMNEYENQEPDIRSSIARDEVAMAAFGLVESAAESRASDIHIQLIPNKPASVHFRINGGLQHHTHIPVSLAESAMRHLYNNGVGEGDATGFSMDKILQRDLLLNLGESKTQFTIRWQSTPAVADSCKIVLRLLSNDTESAIDSLEELGYTDAQCFLLRAGISGLKGTVLVTGPTGSGKTTVLSVLLRNMVTNFPDKAFSSIEDPVEYRIPGVTQHPAEARLVDDKSLTNSQRRRLAFGHIVEALMRQDPDVAMLGEIRSKEVAHAAVEFVDTGHKLLTTNHANSNMDAFDRLANIGVDRSTLCRPGFFSVIVNQTLLPVLCPHCSYKKPVKSRQTEALSALDSLFLDVSKVRFRNVNGCAECSLGIAGRTACSEVMIPDTKFLQLMEQRRYHDALNYWTTEMDVYLGREFEYKGRTSLDHAMYLVLRGEVCPMSVEVEFGSIGLLSAKATVINHPMTRKGNL